MNVNLYPNATKQINTFTDALFKRTCFLDFCDLIVIAFAPDQKKKKVCIELLKEQDVNHSKYCILSKL